MADISSDIKGHLESLFTQQGRDCPDLSEMVRDLKFSRINMEAYRDCPQKNEFIDKYSEIFSR